MLDTVKINHVQHISFTQSRLTDAVSVILSELLSYEHPSNFGAFFYSITLKRYSVFSLYSSPAFKTTLGNCGHAIAFGKCCVSRQKPSRS